MMINSFLLALMTNLISISSFAGTLKVETLEPLAINPPGAKISFSKLSDNFKRKYGIGLKFFNISSERSSNISLSYAKCLADQMDVFMGRIESSPDLFKKYQRLRKDKAISDFEVSIKVPSKSMKVSTVYAVSNDDRKTQAFRFDLRFSDQCLLENNALVFDAEVTRAYNEHIAIKREAQELEEFDKRFNTSSRTAKPFIDEGNKKSEEKSAAASR